MKARGALLVPPALVFAAITAAACSSVVVEPSLSGAASGAGGSGSGGVGGAPPQLSTVSAAATTTTSSGCSTSCGCGDGVVDPGEECDDGNLASGDGCSATCTIESKPILTLFAGNEGDNSISHIDLASGDATPFFGGFKGPGGIKPFTMTGLAVSADSSTLYFARPDTPMQLPLEGDIYAIPTAGGAATPFDAADPSGGPLNAFSLAVGPDHLLYSLLLAPTRIVRYNVGGSKTVVHDSMTSAQTLGFAIAPNGDLFYSDLDHDTVRRVTGMTTSDVFADAGDGLVSPMGLTFDAAGRLYVADKSGQTLRRFTGPHTGSVLADVSAGLFAPIAVVVHPLSGRIFVANMCVGQDSTIIALDPSGALLAPAPFAGAADGLVCTRSLVLGP